mmetsp:Transcript_35287/g.64557  ORF Transcript_35287/g.64557 Transcript_35287/m.64557 type:complete len:428 (+) Transcript_35287:71-1354(+)
MVKLFAAFFLAVFLAGPCSAISLSRGDGAAAQPAEDKLVALQPVLEKLKGLDPKMFGMLSKMITQAAGKDTPRTAFLQYLRDSPEDVQVKLEKLAPILEKLKSLDGHTFGALSGLMSQVSSAQASHRSPALLQATASPCAAQDVDCFTPPGQPLATAAKPSDFFTEDSWAMEEMPPYAANTTGFADRPPCEPKCSWHCGPQKECDEVCEPICAPPKCELACRKSADHCETRCEPPRCAVLCPTSQCTSAGECAKCRTVCGEPKCTTVCSDDCTSMCAKPSCTWKCHPGKCPEPQCKMQCEDEGQACTVDMRSGNGELPPPLGLHVAAEGYASLDPRVLMQPGQAPPVWDVTAPQMGQRNPLHGSSSSGIADESGLPPGVRGLLPKVAKQTMSSAPRRNLEQSKGLSDRGLAPIPALRAKWRAEDGRK